MSKPKTAQELKDSINALKFSLQSKVARLTQHENLPNRDQLIDLIVDDIDAFLRDYFPYQNSGANMHEAKGIVESFRRAVTEIFSYVEEGVTLQSLHEAFLEEIKAARSQMSRPLKQNVNMIIQDTEKAVAKAYSTETSREVVYAPHPTPETASETVAETQIDMNAGESFFILLGDQWNELGLYPDGTTVKSFHPDKEGWDIDHIAMAIAEQMVATGLIHRNSNLEALKASTLEYMNTHSEAKLYVEAYTPILNAVTHYELLAALDAQTHDDAGTQANHVIAEEEFVTTAMT